MTAPVYSEPPGESYRKIIQEQKNLIAELCDALEAYDPIDDDVELIKRGRDSL